MVLEPESWHARLPGERGFGKSAQRWLVAGGIAGIGLAVAATAAAGGFDSLGVARAPATPSPERSATPIETTLSPAPSPSAEPSTPSPTQRPTQTTAPTASAPDLTAAPTPRTYVVQEGDTLSIIAIRYGTSVSALQAANGLGKSDVINVGQRLVIP
jgi:LysM repeat protein